MKTSIILLLAIFTAFCKEVFGGKSIQVSLTNEDEEEFCGGFVMKPERVITLWDCYKKLKGNVIIVYTTTDIKDVEFPPFQILQKTVKVIRRMENSKIQNDVIGLILPEQFKKAPRFVSIPPSQDVRGYFGRDFTKGRDKNYWIKFLPETLRAVPENLPKTLSFCPYRREFNGPYVPNMEIGSPMFDVTGDVFHGLIYYIEEHTTIWLLSSTDKKILKFIKLVNFNEK